MNTILIGFKGSGKTTLGKTLAKELGRSFVDTDKLIEQKYLELRKEKKTCREIYTTHGESYFRDLETNILKELRKQQQSIISVGGGSTDRDQNRKYLSNTGKIIFLDANKDTLSSRLKGQNIPFLSNEEEFEKLFNKRHTHYTSLADHTIDCNNKTPQQLITELLKVI